MGALGCRPATPRPPHRTVHRAAGICVSRNIHYSQKRRHNVVMIATRDDGIALFQSRRTRKFTCTQIHMPHQVQEVMPQVSHNEKQKSSTHAHEPVAVISRMCVPSRTSSSARAPSKDPSAPGPAPLRFPATAHVYGLQPHADPLESALPIDLVARLRRTAAAAAAAAAAAT